MKTYDDAQRIVHRIGGREVVNLRLKAKEESFDPPGISVLMASTATAAALELRRAFPRAKILHEQSKVIASASIEAIRLAGFDVIPNSTRLLPNHYRLIHPDGVAGFSEDNLERLSAAFVDVAVNES